MKTIHKLPVLVALLGLLAAPAALRAEDMKCACMKEHAEKMKPMENKMEAQMKAEAAELDKLVNEMNASTGDKKMEAMSAVLNKMVQTHKAMHDKMAAMHAAPKPGAAAPDAKPEEAKPADPHAAHQH
jgi:hypothetical protein